MPTLEWRDKTPVSTAFDDVYFSAENGLDESTHVFLVGNNLPERFKSLTQPFTILETGFGTGLNFLNVLRLWNNSSPKGQLNFISCEKYPLNIAEMVKSLQVWPELNAEVKLLLASYRNIKSFKGWQRLEVTKGVALHLFFGDVVEMFESLDSAGFVTVQAYFLDGFAPAKNPDMWTSEVFENMAKRSADGTTFATFTAAGFVRRGLEAAGFTVQKVKGYGRKRDMTVGNWCASL